MNLTWHLQNSYKLSLFDELNLPKTKKIKTGFTTDAEALNWLFEKTKHPLLESLLRIRETKKLGTTVEGLIAEIGSDGRIRTHFAQTVAATGRLSSVGPNLQNIPVRTEEGRSIRNAFIADKGFSGLLTADYSQIEMRIMAHLSNDAGLLAAFETGEDLHATVAGLVFGVKANEVDSEMRRQIKGDVLRTCLRLEFVWSCRAVRSLATCCTGFNGSLFPALWWNP